jgi:hypothetical protein
MPDPLSVRFLPPGLTITCPAFRVCGMTQQGLIHRRRFFAVDFHSLSQFTFRRTATAQHKRFAAGRD